MSSTSSISSSPIWGMPFKAPVFPPIQQDFDPGAMHPASIIPLQEMSELADRVVKNKSDEIHPASIPAPTKLIRDGYGELVLRVRDGKTLRPVTREEYEKAYRIFQKYAPSLDEVPKPLAKSRIAMMREELQKIIPNVVATFIPRTLHDLLYIKKSIEEDVEREKPFWSKNFKKNPTEEQLRNFHIRSTYNSWFVDIEGTKSDSAFFPKIEICRPSDVGRHLSKLLDIGYRLNLAACKAIDLFGKDVEDLSLHQIQELVDDQLKYLKAFSKRLNTHFRHAKKEYAPLSACFADFAADLPKSSYYERLTGIKKIVFVECHESMTKKILCCRGGCLATDSPVKKTPSQKEEPYSISFGSAPFPGIVNDIGACAYHHMFGLWLSGKEDSYILVLDPAIESAHTFHTPAYTALESLFGNGETWHFRFKVSKDELRKIGGIFATGRGFEPGMTKSQKLDFIKSPLTVQQTVDKFKDLKKNNVILIYHVDLDIFKRIISSEDDLTIVELPKI